MTVGAGTVVKATKKKSPIQKTVKAPDGGNGQTHLTREDIERLKTILVNERKKHNQTIENAEAALKQSVESPYRISELGTDNQMREETSRSLSEANKMVRLINEALQRMEDCKYDGICIKCRRPIPKERLFAVPVTKKCCACKNGDQY